MVPQVNAEQVEALTLLHGPDRVFERMATMTRLELIELLKTRRLDAENAKREATNTENVPAFSMAFGRVREIDEIILILTHNFIYEG